MAFDSTYEERAGILEYQAFFSRSEAETRAHRICYHRTETRQRKDGTIEFQHTLTAPVGMKPAPQPIEEQLELITREQYLAGIKRFL